MRQTNDHDQPLHSVRQPRPQCRQGFRVFRRDYEATMDLLTEHAHRVQRMQPRAAGGNAAQATALDEIYALMEQVQAQAPTFFEPDMGELMEHIGDGNYVTHPATIDY